MLVLRNSRQFVSRVTCEMSVYLELICNISPICVVNWLFTTDVVDHQTRWLQNDSRENEHGTRKWPICKRTTSEADLIFIFHVSFGSLWRKKRQNNTPFLRSSPQTPWVQVSEIFGNLPGIFGHTKSWDQIFSFTEVSRSSWGPCWGVAPENAGQQHIFKGKHRY